jgi:hypothetical protein
MHLALEFLHLEIWKIQARIWQDLWTTSHGRKSLDGFALCCAHSSFFFFIPARPVHISHAMYSIFPFWSFFGTSNVQATAAYDGLIGPRD